MNYFILLYIMNMGLYCITATKNSKLTTEEIITSNGYPFQSYSNVPTEDGYLLELHRIPYGRLDTNTSRPVVLLMHGLIGSSRNFVVMGQKRGLAFYLADRGYDVWLGNARGTPNSQKHAILDPYMDKQYWDFSWHEIGVYDLPAMFEIIRTVTGKERINYVGHSQGTTSFYVMASLRPEYNENITLAISLAPQAYMTHIPNFFLKGVSALEPILNPLSKLIGLQEWPPKPLPDLASLVIPPLCSVRGFQEACAVLLYFIDVYNPSQTNKDDISGIISGLPSGASNQFLHYAQNINSGEFRQFDYGPNENLRVYGTEQPPSYNLTNIKSPIALYHAEGDILVHRKDVDRLCHELPNCIYNHEILLNDFRHLDFIFAKDAVKLIYEDLLKLLNRYN